MNGPLTKSALNFSGLAAHEQVDSLMLVVKDVEESIFEFHKSLISSARHIYRLALTRRCAFFYEILDVVVIYVVC